MSVNRLSNLQDFYALLAVLTRSPGSQTLSTCTGRMQWPDRGVYFFMENGENRSDSGIGPRVVRVGTHALNEKSGAKLWTRLSQHRGSPSSGRGNHRGSIFRLIVGTALIARNGYTYPTWGAGNNAPSEVRAGERALEREVSAIIGAMPFVCLPIADLPGPQSLRGYVERNAIALLSNFGPEPLDPPSSEWLGSYCPRERVRRSGLWNSNHVEEKYDSGFLRCFESAVAAVVRDT